MKWLCLFFWCNHNTCDETVWIDDILFQKFKCSRCGKPSTFYGYVGTLDELTFEVKK